MNQNESIYLTTLHNREFSVDDVQTVLEPLFGNYYGTERLRRMIKRSDHIWCVFDKESQRFIGSAVLSEFQNRRNLYLELFGIEKTNQGRGVGRLLLDSIVRWAKHHYQTIFLHTQINNDRAIGLYEKFRFHKEFLIKDFFRRSFHPTLISLRETDVFQMRLDFLKSTEAREHFPIDCKKK